MVARVARPELMGRKNIIVTQRRGASLLSAQVAVERKKNLTTEERERPSENRKAARVWISGLEEFSREFGDRGWSTICRRRRFFCAAPDTTKAAVSVGRLRFRPARTRSKADIVKVPRLPVLDDAIQGDMPKFRDIYNVIRKDESARLPDARAAQAGLPIDPNMPHHCWKRASTRSTAIMKTIFEKWEKQRRSSAAPPVFIVVCNNTSTSKLVLRLDFRLRKDRRRRRKAKTRIVQGKLPLFSNVNENGRWRVALPHVPDRQRTAGIWRGAVSRISGKWPRAKSRSSRAKSGARGEIDRRH